MGVQEEFIAQAGRGLLKLVKSEHERLQEAHEGLRQIKGFKNWIASPVMFLPSRKEVGTWRVRVYQKVDSGGWPHTGMSPYINVNLRFNDACIYCAVDVGGIHRVSDVWASSFTTPERVAIVSYTLWESILTCAPEDMDDEDEGVVYEEDLYEGENEAESTQN